jgi:ADP-ribose pyrophosphatase YjhB (NUDIX family)
MAGQDISWSTPRETFNLRVAAVIGHGHKVLLCTVDGLGYWFLPGGRVVSGSRLSSPWGLEQQPNGQWR